MPTPPPDPEERLQFLARIMEQIKNNNTGQRRPPHGVDKPTTRPPPPMDEADAYFAQMKQKYPYGQGVGEGEIAPAPSGQQNVYQLRNSLSTPLTTGPEDINDPVYAPLRQPLPREFQPQRPLSLEEIRRRWGVPKMENL